MIRKFFFVFIGVFLLFSSTQAAKNLLKNGDFSKWKKGVAVPVDWWMHSYKTLKNGELGREIINGENAVKFTNALQVHGLQQMVKIKGGELYELSCKAKLQISPWFFAIAVQWRDKNGRAVGKYNWTYSSGSDADFKTLSVKNIEAPANAVMARIRIYPYGVNKKGRIVEGTILVKDVSFIQREKETIKEPYRTSAAIPLLEKADVKVDGKGNDADWKKAVVLSNFTEPESYMTVQEQTIVKVLADAHNLYILARMYSKNPKELKKIIRSPRDEMRTEGDTLEIFFKPFPKSKEQYHILIDPAGSIRDIKEIWRKSPNSHGLMVDSRNNWNPTLDSKVEITNDGWVVEMKIPLKDIGIKGSPASGKWLANIARADYKNKKFSSWSMLPQIIFQKNKDWGKWTFLKGIPAVGKFMITPNGGNSTFDMTMNNPYSSAINIEVRVDTLSNDYVLKLGQKKEQLAANTQDVLIRSTIELSKQLYWVSVWADKQLLYRNGLKPYSKFIAISYYDPENVVGNKLYLASDMRSFKPFTMGTNFKADIGKHFISRKKTGADIVVELPNGIEATYLDMIKWNKVRFKPTSARKGAKLVRNKLEYTQYIFEVPALMIRKGSAGQSTMIFFESNWKKGRRGKAYIYARWKGGVQPLREYDIEIIKIGKMTPFKRTQSRWDYLSVEFARMWLDNPVKTLKQLGINTIPVPLHPEKDKYYGTTENRKSLYDKFVSELKANSYYLMVQSDTNPNWWEWTQGKDPDKASRVIDINGKAVKNMYNCITFCQLYRGRYYQNWVSSMINSIAIKEYGITWAVLDFEFWPVTMFDDGCYCEHCLQEFKIWCKSNSYKNINTSPKDFMKEKSANQNAVEAWTKFSKWRFRKLFADVKQELAGTIKNRQTWTGPENKFLVSEWQAPQKHLVGIIDYFDTCLYFAPSICNDRLTKTLKSFGTKFPSLVAACAPTPMWTQAAKVPPSDNLYVIFESVVAKCQGFEWYPYWSFDMLNLKVMMDGYRAIVPFEDIYLDGEVIISVPCSGGESSARAIKLGDEMLLLVRDYKLKKTEKVTLTVPGKANVEIFDTHSGKKLGTISGKNRKLVLKLNRKCKARLLYVGAAGKYNQRKFK